MPSEALLAPTYTDSLSSSEVLTSPGSGVATEADSFNEEWSISRQTQTKTVYRITFEGEHPAWIDAVMLKLNELLDLPHNWDTYGADRINVNSTIFIFEMLVELISKGIPQPAIVPITEGGVQMEWHINGANLEISMQPDRATEYYIYHDQNVYEEKEDEFNFNRIRLPSDFNECIDTFLGCIRN